jgi:ABC-type multidrug transport system fused ATPase/permease subunit
MTEILQIALSEKSLASVLIILLTGIVIFFIRMYLVKQKSDIAKLSSDLADSRIKFQEKIEKIQSDSLDLVKLLETFRANDTINSSEVVRLRESLAKLNDNLDKMVEKTNMHSKALAVLSKLIKRR